MVRKIQKSKASSIKLIPPVKKTKTKKTLKLSNGFHGNENEDAQPDMEVDNQIEETNGNSETQKNVRTVQPAESHDSNSSEPGRVAESSRKRKPQIAIEDERKRKADVNSKAKRQKVLLEVPKISTVTGKLFVIGQNDVGQLGLGEDAGEKKRPSVLELPHSIVGIAAGGMHSVCLTESGEVMTFGCNDEGALGRDTTEEGSEYIPRKVDIPERIVQISAGDSHSAALSDSGQVYIWGNFRNGNGSMGLVRSGLKQILPIKILTGKTIVKIASGSDHLVCLSEEGFVYTCGCGEAGQLGRFNETAVEDGGRRGIMSLLTPDKVLVAKTEKAGFVNNIWTGSYSTYVKTQRSGLIYGFGLNNESQLGCVEPSKIFKPKQLASFNNNVWQQIDGDLHHALAMDATGLVFSLGSDSYGRLGLGEDTGNISVPTAIPALQDAKCIDISSGNCCSYAVADDGNVFSWGMGTNCQLGHGNDDDQILPRLIEGNFLNSWKAFKISGGGQHTLILAHPRGSLKENEK